MIPPMDVQAELRKLIGKRITVSDLRQTFQLDGKLGWDGCQFSVDRRYGSLPFRPEQAIRFHASAKHPRWLFIERS